MPKPRPNYKPFNQVQRESKCLSFNGNPEFVIMPNQPRANMTSQADQNMSEKRKANAKHPALEQLIAMFHGALDEDTVTVVWNDCDGNVDEALDILTSVATNAEPEKFQIPDCSNLVLKNEATPTLSSQPVKSWPHQSAIPVSTKSTSKPALNPHAASFQVLSPKENILSKIKNGTKVLLLMRGVPGSGKSTLAQQIKGSSGVVLSTDDFFHTENGRYSYKKDLLGRAHDWNRDRCLDDLKKGVNPIIIDNTNLEAWEMKPYVDMALDYDYWVEILEPDTPWRHKARILAQKNSHSVPKEKIELMLEKLQIPVKAKDLVKEAFQKKKALGNHKSAFTASEPLKPTPAPISSASSCPNFPPQPSNPVLESWKGMPSATENTFFGQKPQRARKWANCQPSTSNSSSASSWLSEAEVARKWAYEESSQGSIGSRAMETAPAIGENDAKDDGEDKATQTQYSDYFDSQSDGMPLLQVLMARPRAISLSTGNISNNSPEPGMKQKWMLEKGCNTEEIQEEPSPNNLASLQAWFPSNTPEDLGDVLDKCGGDLIWAVNLLLDSGYQMVETTPDFSTITAPDSNISELNPVLPPLEDLVIDSNVVAENSSISLEAMEIMEDKKAKARLEAKRLKEELESAFSASSGISERARRICGRDYEDFRACTIRKAREARDSHVEDQVAAIEAMYGPAGDQNVPFVSVPDNQDGLPFSRQSGEEEMLSFTIDPNMAEQLQYYFGPPPTLLESHCQYWTPENLTLQIPKALAQQLHMYWCASLVNPIMPAQDWEFAYDEEFAQYLSRMESEQFTTLQNVMDFEYAMQLAENDKLLGQVHKRDSLATKLSRQMLRENFPSVYPLALEAVFEAHLYNYDATVESVAASYNVAQAEPRQFQGPSLKTKPVELEELDEEDYVYRSARDLRAEAVLYYQMKTEAMQKAQDQYRKGMKAAAAFYAEKGRRFIELYKTANRHAAQVIVEESNASNDQRTLDLHLLYVTEALAVLEAFLNQCNDAGTVLNIITGKGKHSVDGRAKIKPAVMEFLKSRNMSFEHVNAGMLKVKLNRRGK